MLVFSLLFTILLHPSVSGRYGIFLESEEGDKYSEFIYYLEAHSASRIVIDFNEENMRCLLEYLEMVLGKIDLDDDFAQQMYASGTLY